MDYFDYLSVATEAGIPPEKLAEVEAFTRDEYPGDAMLFELRMLRRCKAVRDRKVTIDELLEHVRTSAEAEALTENLPVPGGPLHV